MPPKRTYEIKATEICRAALDRGELEPALDYAGQMSHWAYRVMIAGKMRQRLFHCGTVNKLIEAGEARRIGNRIVKATKGDVK